MNIAFTGVGIICAIGNNKQQVLSALRTERSGIGRIKYLSSEHLELPVGEVKLSDKEMKEALLIPEKDEASRTALMGILAVKEALDDAGIDKDTKGTRRIILISGTSVGGMDITEKHLLEKGAMESMSSFVPSGKADFMKHHDAGSTTKQIAEYFGLFDECITVSTACSSAANAIVVGAKLLNSGRADVIVAGGTEALTKFHLNGFNSLMILDKEKCRPFDATRNGLNLGEGAGFLVMKKDTTGERRTDIYGYLTGYGNTCDAFHQTASSPDGEGAYSAMKEALDMADISAEEITYVNAHGTATENNDESESAALRKIFAERMPFISSTKAFTGHTTSASGGIETIICLLAMNGNFVPANLNFKVKMQQGILPAKGTDNVKLTNVLCNSFGFGGNDTSLLISRVPSREKEPFQGITDDDIKIIAKREITDALQLSAITQYVKPIEARRMGNLLKASLLTSLQVLQDASIDRPDAIVAATTWGCMEMSEKLLRQLSEEGETLLKPTYFMQSTHNTIASNIAIKTRCRGYNITYTQGERSFSLAMEDAKMLLKSGRYGNVLVVCCDEATPLMRKLLLASGQKNIPDIYSVSILLSCGR